MYHAQMIIATWVEQMVALNMLINSMPSTGKLKHLILNNGEDRMEDAEAEEEKTTSSVDHNLARVQRHLKL